MPTRAWPITAAFARQHRFKPRFAWHHLAVAARAMSRFAFLAAAPRHPPFAGEAARLAVKLAPTHGLAVATR